MIDSRGGKGAKMLKWLFKRDPAKDAGQTLYAACAAAARNPDYYRHLGVPDTVEGRFELYALHVILVIHRLRDEPGSAIVSQALFDALLQGLDDGLRQMGVGDLSVGKKMRKLGEALYGRAKNLDDALNGLPDVSRLFAFLDRTVYGGEAQLPSAGLADWVISAQTNLAGQDLAALLAGVVSFPGVVIEGAAA